MEWKLKKMWIQDNKVLMKEVTNNLREKICGKFSLKSIDLHKMTLLLISLAVKRVLQRGKLTTATGHFNYEGN
jgi:hypothetical protein